MDVSRVLCFWGWCGVGVEMKGLLMPYARVCVGCMVFDKLNVYSLLWFLFCWVRFPVVMGVSRCL